MDELSTFPGAPHDDFVDALTQALNYARGSRDFLGLALFYQGQKARDLYRTNANVAATAAQLEVSVEQVQEWINDGDTSELTRIYEQTRLDLERGVDPWSGAPERAARPQPKPSIDQPRVDAAWKMVISNEGIYDKN